MVEGALAASFVGSLVFPTALGLQQRFFYAPLRITSDRRIVGPLLGFGSVFLSGCCASLAAVGILKGYREILSWKSGENKWLDELAVDWQDVFVSGLGSALVFRILGGRFRSSLPSNLIKPGAFARASIPARKSRAISVTARERLNKIGKKFGCHTCGRKWLVHKFHRDHQPPSALVKEGQTQVFYPQCQRCSAVQGGAVAQGSNYVVTHGTSLRLYHLWIPVPLAWFGLKYAKSDQQGSNSQSSVVHMPNMAVVSSNFQVSEGKEIESGGKETELDTSQLPSKPVVVGWEDDINIVLEEAEENTWKPVSELQIDTSLQEEMRKAEQLHTKEDIENIHVVIRIIAATAVVLLWLLGPS